MTFDDDAHPRRVQILAALAAGLLVTLLVRVLLTDDWTVAGMFGFAAAQLVAELFAPTNGGPPDDEAPVREIEPSV